MLSQQHMRPPCGLSESPRRKSNFQRSESTASKARRQQLPLPSRGRKTALGSWVQAHVRHHAFGQHPFYFSHCTPYAERQYYKAKKGEILIDPEMQKELLAIFERNGANTSIGFDSYEERVVLVEK